MISIDDFRKLEMKIGRITAAESIAGSDKLLKLTVDLGPETRQIIAGIAKWYAPETLVGKQVPVLMNLEPRTFMGLESQGMIICVDVEGKPVLLHPDKEVTDGARLT